MRRVRVLQSALVDLDVGCYREDSLAGDGGAHLQPSCRQEAPKHMLRQWCYFYLFISSRSCHLDGSDAKRLFYQLCIVLRFFPLFHPIPPGM